MPPNTSIQKDAILAITKSATVFISYLASNAREATTKRTVVPNDILAALKEIEMDGLMDLGKKDAEGKPLGRLEREIEAFEETARGKRKDYRDKMKAREGGISAVDSSGKDERKKKGGGKSVQERITSQSPNRKRSEGEGETDDSDGEPERKRMRQTNGQASVPRAEDHDATEPEENAEDEEAEVEEVEEGDEGDEGDEDENEDEEEDDEEGERADDLDDDSAGEQLRQMARNGEAESDSDDESD